LNTAAVDLLMAKWPLLWGGHFGFGGLWRRFSPDMLTSREGLAKERHRSG
jgi:hypothetical protein